MTDLLAEPEEPDLAARQEAGGVPVCLICDRAEPEHPVAFVDALGHDHRCRLFFAAPVVPPRAPDRTGQGCARPAPNFVPPNLPIIGVTWFLARLLGMDWGRAAAWSGGVEAVYCEDEPCTVAPDVLRRASVAHVSEGPLCRARRVARRCILVARLLGRGTWTMAVHAGDMANRSRVGRHLAIRPLRDGTERHRVCRLAARRMATVVGRLQVDRVNR